jgi:hypothetical protein
MNSISAAVTTNTINIRFIPAPADSGSLGNQLYYVIAILIDSDHIIFTKSAYFVWMNKIPNNKKTTQPGT